MGAGAEAETRAEAEGAAGGEREGAAGAAGAGEAGERNSGLLIAPVSLKNNIILGEVNVDSVLCPARVWKMWRK